jgi:hypothetical protein
MENNDFDDNPSSLYVDNTTECFDAVMVQSCESRHPFARV